MMRNMRIDLQPGGDPRYQEAERSAGQNCCHWILSDLVGSEQPGVELRRADQSESLKLTQLTQFITLVFV